MADAGQNKCAGEELSRLRSLSRLQQLQLRGCFRVTDAGLRSVGALVSLTSLDCQECWQTTAAGLAGLSGAGRITEAWWGAGACVSALLNCIFEHGSISA